MRAQKNIPEQLKLSDFEDKSLLILDDDDPLRGRLARAMEKKGFKVSQAEGVKKGLDAVKNNKPAFAVVDLKLGDGNKVQISKCPNDHGKIKSPLCCGQDMSCSA